MGGWGEARLLTGLDRGPTEERGEGAGKGPPYMPLRALPQEQLGGAVPEQSRPCFVQACPNKQAVLCTVTPVKVL